MTLHRRSALPITSIGIVALVIAVLGALWLSSEGRAAARAHDDARALWSSKEPTTYSFDYGYCSGMCVDCTFRITVEHGKVTDVVPRQPGCELGRRSAPTVETVFDLEKDDRSAAMTDSFKIRYDRTWGFPRSVSIRCPPDTSDCGKGYGISDFRAS